MLRNLDVVADAGGGQSALELVELLLLASLPLLHRLRALLRVVQRLGLHPGNRYLRFRIASS